MTSHAARKRMRRTDPRRSVPVGIFMFAFAIFAIYFSLTKTLPFIGGEGGHLYHVQLPGNLSQVNSKTPIRVNGVEVGHVDKVELVNGGRASAVTLRITDKHVQLRQDATAIARWRTLLGGRMELSLNTGSPSAPKLAGDTIKAGAGSVQVEFDDLLATVRKPTDDRLRTFLKEWSTGFDGDAAGKVIDKTAPDLDTTAEAMRAVQGQLPDDLRELVASGAKTVSGLSRDENALRGLIDGGATTLQTTGGDAQQIADTFETAPAAMDSTIRAANAVNAALPDLDHLTSDLRPGARAIAPTVKVALPMARALDTVLRSTQPLLTDLRPAVARLASVSRSGYQVFTSLAPTINRLNKDTLPWLKSADSDTKLPVYQMIGPVVSVLQGAAGEYDDIGTALHFPPTPSENSIGDIPCSTFLTDPTASQLITCKGLLSALQYVYTGQRAKK